MQLLIDSIKIKLNSFHQEKVKLIDEFNFQETLNKVNKDFHYSLPQTYLQNGIFNLKKYYVVALLDPLNEHAVSRAVDPFWHSHVLHTKDYFYFCNLIFNQYIHHQPLNEDDPLECQAVSELYDYTLSVYKQIFKTIDGEWWPENKISDMRKGPTVCRHYFVTDELIRNEARFKDRFLMAS